MAKKIKKRPNMGVVPVDPDLEEVDEDRAFEIEMDDELNEILFVHHYRRKWGDEFDADIEHGFNMDESRAVIGVMLQIMQVIENKIKAQMGQKVTPEPVEKNPMKDNPVQ